MSTKLTDITKQLGKFLTSFESSGLLKETNGISGIPIIEAHIQKCWLDADKRCINIFTGNHINESTNCLNIVNVSVAERNRRKGLFTDFLELMEGFDYSSYLDNLLYYYVRVDKVMNPVLDEFLPKKGYIRTKAENETHFSYYKIVRNKRDTVSKFVAPPAFQYLYNLPPG